MNFEEDTTSGRLARPLRRIKKSGTGYERLQSPEGILPGEPIPSVEGWVLLLRHLPETAQTVEVRNLFSSVESDPEFFGNVTGIRLPIDDYGNCSGWALVELDSKIGFDRAIETLNGSSYFLYENSTESGEGEGVKTSNAPDSIEGSPDGNTLNGKKGKVLKVTPAFIAEEDADPVESMEKQEEVDLIPGMMKRARENEVQDAVDEDGLQNTDAVVKRMKEE